MSNANSANSMSAPRKSLLAHLQTLPDPRLDRRKEHLLSEVLCMGLCCLLCDGENFVDMEDFGRAKRAWLQTFLTLPGGIPSHDTFNRVFSAVKPEHFMECFLQWTQGLRQALHQEIVAIDGKALRRAKRRDQPIPYMVNAWAKENGLVLGQWRVDDKSNEITAIPHLLRVLELAGCIVTVDAMGCQKNIAKEISEADADYVLALKGNQQTVYEEVKDFFTTVLAEAKKPLAQRTCPVKPEMWQHLETVEKEHGRLTVRRYWQCTDIAWFADRHEWENLRSFGMVESITTQNGVTTTDRRCYLNSLLLNVHTFARAVRGHWGVENQLHWTLDVSFNEDQSRARTGHAPENLSTLRCLALNLLKQNQTRKSSLRAKRKIAGWDNDFLKELLNF